MHHPDQIHIEMIDDPVRSTPPMRPACLVTGCACKDARIVSPRQAAFFAALARRNGETADRVISPETAWSIAAVVAASSIPEMAA